MTEDSKIHGYDFLSGLLIDLESGRPDSSRLSELKTQICDNLGLRVSHGSAISIGLDHIHFSRTEFLSDKFNSYDFILLSPQGTPWRAYRGRTRAQLDTVSEMLARTIDVDSVPVLGICGGHQFLAMSFGAEVDFMDPAFVGSDIQSYPEEAVAERGTVSVETIEDDRIFEGLPAHPATFAVMESHTEEVKNIPTRFVNLARSALSEIQLITIPGALVYGMAFHPERGWDKNAGPEQKAPAGRTLLRNFFRLVHNNNRIES